MRKTIMIIMALAFMVVAYGSTALGADSASRQGQIKYVSQNPCVLGFAFRGFQPGTHGRLEALISGTVYTSQFQVPTPNGVRAWHIHSIIGDPHPPTIVQFRIMVEGMDHVFSGSVNCDCGPGGEGGSGGSGGTGGTGATTASAASAVTSQPGFAG